MIKLVGQYDMTDVYVRVSLRAASISKLWTCSMVSINRAQMFGKYGTFRQTDMINV